MYDERNIVRHCPNCGTKGDTCFFKNGSISVLRCLDCGDATATRESPFSLANFVVGASNQLAFNSACCVAQSTGWNSNPLFIHGVHGAGKTHLLDGLCRKFVEHHPTKHWLYRTGEEFTNEFLSTLIPSDVRVAENRLNAFRRKMRDADLFVIDDVHFLADKTATQEELFHTFNAITATGRQVVAASDRHPSLIDGLREPLASRLASGLVLRMEPMDHKKRSLGCGACGSHRIECRLMKLQSICYCFVCHKTFER